MSIPLTFIATNYPSYLAQVDQIIETLTQPNDHMKLQNVAKDLLNL